MSGSFGATPHFGFPTTGSSMFGATNNTGGLFGATQNKPGNIFGTSNQPVTSSTSMGFGGGISGTNLFGSTNTASTGGLFSPQNNVFGLNKPVEAAGNFGNSTGSGGLFQNTSNTFGGPSVSHQQPGTTVKFNPPVSKPGNTRHQCIAAMKQYENKSMEELRLEDYQAGRKGPSNAQGGGVAAIGGLFKSPNTINSMFGSSSSNTGPSSRQQKTTFGANAPGGFGTSGNLFGSQIQGQPTTASLFKSINQGTSSAPNTGLTANNTRPMGQPGFSGLFGATGTGPVPFGHPIGVGTFGPQTSTASGLGTGAHPFGQTNTGFGTGRTQSSMSPSMGTNTGLFGGETNTGLSNVGPQTSTATGLGTGVGSFGPTNTFIGTFGPQTSTASGLDTGARPFGQTNTGFGTGSTQPLSTGPVLGQWTDSKTNMFGNTPAVVGTGTTPFGPVGVGQGSGLRLGSNNLPQQPVVLTDPGATVFQKALLNALKDSPFGDSPLFRNPLADTKKREERLKSTNFPRLATPTHLKRTPQRATMYLPKTLTPQGSGSSSRSLLFAGLDEEQLSITKGTFVPRKSIKRLVLKDAGSRVVKVLKEDEISLQPDPKDTITDFNLHKAHNQSDTTEKVTGGGDSEQERRYEQQERKEEQHENQGPPHPAGIVLSRFGYYTIPSVEELANFVDENGHCLVENFTVGRNDYGSVYFPGIVNVFGLNLDDIVHFRRKEVIVYPDATHKPPQGEGLNRRAQVTLDRVWPVDETRGSEIRSPERLVQVDYQSSLETTCRRQGQEFLDYRYETGSWVYEVTHF